MISISRALPLFFITLLAAAAYTEPARAACLPASPVNGDDVVCDDVTVSTGFDAGTATGLTITTSGAARLDESLGAFDSAILVSDDNTITIGADAIITVTTTDGFGINAGDNNTITNQGEIIILNMVDDATAINVGDGNTVVNEGTITIVDDNGTGIRGNDNNDVSNTGTIDLMGNFTRGISAGNRSNPQLPSDVSNRGTLNVRGSDSRGISVGDGWVRGPIVGEAVAADPGVINFATGTINVTGDRSVGIFAGDPSNTANTNNSFVRNDGTINVTGIDAIGISVGGNDLVTPFDIQGTTPLDVANVVNTGMIIGGPEAMPLIMIREFVAGSENRVINSAGGEIRADPTFRVDADRGVAIRGTVGTEFVFNSGEIQGAIELLDGNDRYIHAPGAALTNPDLGPSVFGGLGNDVAVLAENFVVDETFDLRTLDGFETVEVRGGTYGWELINGENFTGSVDIADNGLLRVVTPVMLGGDFRANQTGTLELTLDGTTPLTVLGSATFAGQLVLNLDPSITPGSPALLAISTNGLALGRFEFNERSGLDLFDLSYDSSGLTFEFLSSGTAEGVAIGSTQRAIAKHLDDIKAVGSPSPDLQNLLDEFDTASGQLSSVFEAFSPEIYDAQTQAVVDGGRRVTNLLFNRPRECAMGERVPWQKADAQLPCHARTWSPWLATVGGIRSREKFGDHSGYDAQMGGLVFGIDMRPIDNLNLTLAIANQRGTVSGNGRGASTIMLTDLVGQAAWNRGPLRVQAAVGWGHGIHQNRRRIRFATAGVTGTDVRGLEDSDSDRISLGAEVGYVFDVGPIKVEPIGGLDWAWVYQRPINEDETSGFGVRIDRREDTVGSLNGGVRVSTSYLHSRYLAQWLLWMDGVWQPSIDIRWRQVLTGWEREIDARLQGAPDSVSDFTIKGREDRGGAEIAVGVIFTPKDANRLQFDLRYESFVASRTVSHDLVGSVRIGF